MGLARLSVLSSRGLAPVTLLRLWFAASAVAFAAVLIWAFAPVMLFVLLLTAGLGAVSFLMIRLARWIGERRTGERR